MSTMQRGKTLEILKRYKDASLDKLLTELIAENDGIEPKDVTIEYIREQREKTLYPNVRYDTGCAIGGYSSEGLTVSTQDELKALARQVEEEGRALYRL